MYCDQSPLSGTMKKLEKAIENVENKKIGDATFITMNVAEVDVPVEIDDGNNFR